VSTYMGVTNFEKIVKFLAHPLYLFLSCDFDLDPMILSYEFGLDIPNIWSFSRPRGLSGKSVLLIRDD